MQNDHTQRQEPPARLSTDEARSAVGLNVVRWVLLISLVLAILALSAIWITGALTTPQADHNGVVSGQARAPEAGCRP